MHESTDSVLGPWGQEQQRKDERLTTSPGIVLHDATVIWSKDPQLLLASSFPTSVRVLDAFMEIFPVAFLSKNPKVRQSVVEFFVGAIKNAATASLHAHHQQNVLQNVFCAYLRTLQLMTQQRKSFSAGPFLTLLHQFFQVLHQHSYKHTLIQTAE